MAWFLTGLLFFSITGTLADAECHCSTAAACAVFPSTPCSQVGCQEGWFGSYCQRRNIAFGRNATQSSTYSENNANTGNTTHRFEARFAVDGRSTTDFYSKPLTCTHALEGVQTWTVYLNNSNTDKIQHIKLYLREGFLNRYNGMKIYVGGQLCTEWSLNTHPPAVADVKCQQALTGNNLTIQTSNFLALCEVQIFVCSDGWFGEDCDKQCHCSRNTEVCDKITGQCLSGCAPGYIGPDCQTACPDGYYGDCTSRCGNCLNAAFCNKATGICPLGCDPGWHTDTCLQPCPDGYYGPSCGFQCGNCVDGDVCIKTNGTCLEGCAAGWLKDTCDQACPDGYYGTDCTSKCGNCLDNDVCNKSTGTCPNGCAAGWMNNTCHNVCEDGRYGSGCTSDCGPCKSGTVCDKTKGTCGSGCDGGYSGTRCELCEDGRYGSGCTSECGHCKSGTVCDKTNGTCGSGCDGGYSGARCEQRPATSGHSNQVVQVAATLGTLLVLAAIALLTSIIYIRRLKKQLGVLQKKPEDNYISLDERTKDPVVENTYEQIKNSTPYINVGDHPQGRI